MRNMFFLATIVLAACAIFCAAAAPQTETPPPPTTAVRTTARTIELDLGNDITMKLTLFPAGESLMGSPGTEKERAKNESPRHEVTISKPFFMGIYAVTQAPYEQVMGNNPSKFKGADWYAESYAGATSTDPKGPESGAERVIRGGIWHDYPRDCRSAKREGRQP